MSHFEKLRSIVNSAKRELHVSQLLLRDPRVPRLAKWLLGAALAYLASPIDLIPDFIPVLGHLDDVIVVPGLVILACWLIPEGVIEDCRMRARTDAHEREGPCETGTSQQ